MIGALLRRLHMRCVVLFHVYTQELVRQQVLEKERVKMEEKRHREREDALEEAKLAAERERMRQDFEREKEKARRKEVNIIAARIKG